MVSSYRANDGTQAFPDIEKFLQRVFPEVRHFSMPDTNANK